MAKLTVQFMENGDFELPSEETMAKWIEAAIERDTTLNVLFVYQHEPEAIADLAICVPVLIRESQEQEKSFEEHLAHLLIHGALHAHGYDHMNDEDAEVMEMKEIKALMSLGFDNPYADRELV